MKILVTGGAGFIGSHLVEKLLKEGHQVLVVDNFHSYYSLERKIQNVLESLGFHKLKLSSLEALNTFLKEQKLRDYKLFITDILDMDQMEKIIEEERPEALIHLAALAGVRPSLEKALDYAKVNILASLQLLELAKKYSISKIVQASSSSVYGNAKAEIFEEDMKLDAPISPYAASKKSAELFAYTYSHLYEMAIVQLRFFTVYGERQRPDLAIHHFIKQIEEGKEILVFGDGNSFRDYTYVGDIIEGIYASLLYVERHPNCFEVFNLASSRKISLSEMISVIEKALGKKAKIRFVEKQAGDVEKTYASIEKAKKNLSYQVNTSFEEGIQKFITWYRKELKK